MHVSSPHASESAARQIRRIVRGEVIEPRDSAYDGARTTYFNAYDRKPAFIIRPADAADVGRTVLLARELGLELAVRSGGHSVAGHGACDGGIMLDLASLRALDIDTASRTAWADTGLTAGEYTRAVGAHGLATGFGDNPSVGIGGITLGGGIGFLHRKHGLTIDSLLAADVVTADGQLVRADAESHPDLFWAIRGGGGNFGVATRFLYQLQEADRVIGGMLMLPATPERIVALMEEAVGAPDGLSGMINVMVAPPAPPFPPELHGRPIVMAMLVHSGPEDEGERVFTRMRALGTPVMDAVRPMSYPQIYEGAEGAPHPPGMAVHSFFMDRFSRTDADRILDGLSAGPGVFRVAQFRVLGGAVARVSPDATAFAHRKRGIHGMTAAAYQQQADAAQMQAWTDQLAGELEQGGPGAYANFVGNEGPARVRAVYPDPVWDRLRTIKSRYDPANVFHHNQNIPPADAAAD